MGPVLSILGVLGPGVVGAVYIYTNHGGGRTSNNNVADQGNITAAINTTSCTKYLLVLSLHYHLYSSLLRRI